MHYVANIPVTFQDVMFTMWNTAKIQLMQSYKQFYQTSCNYLFISSLFYIFFTPSASGCRLLLLLHPDKNMISWRSWIFIGVAVANTYWLAQSCFRLMKPVTWPAERLYINYTPMKLDSAPVLLHFVLLCAIFSWNPSCYHKVVATWGPYKSNSVSVRLENIIKYNM